MEKQYIKMPDGWVRVQSYDDYMSTENESPELYQNNMYNRLKKSKAIARDETMRIEQLKTVHEYKPTESKQGAEELRRAKEEEREQALLKREEAMNKSALFGAGIILIVLAALTLFAHFVIWLTPGLSWHSVIQNLTFGLLQGLYYLFKSFYWLCTTVFNYIVIDLIGFQF